MHSRPRRAQSVRPARTIRSQGVYAGSGLTADTDSSGQNREFGPRSKRKAAFWGRKWTGSGVWATNQSPAGLFRRLGRGAIWEGGKTANETPVQKCACKTSIPSAIARPRIRDASMAPTPNLVQKRAIFQRLDCFMAPTPNLVQSRRGSGISCPAVWSAACQFWFNRGKVTCLKRHTPQDPRTKSA